MKKCKVCGQMKPLEEFYATKSGWRFTDCKACFRARQNSYRLDPVIRERIRERDRKRACRSKNASGTDPGRFCRTFINNAIRDGRITRQPCEICGDESEAHHPDYSKPDEVRWLCFKHHRELEHDQIVGSI